MNDSLIPVAPPQALSLASVGSLMAAAIEKGIDVKELVELQRQLKKDAAEEAFNHAMQRFQSECPEISHNEQADVRARDGGKGYSYTFASLPHIVRTIKPVLERCGLTYSFDNKVDKSMITITCTIHHVLGHSRSSTFEAGASGAPGMSEIQKFASTTTYGQRYALKLALGLMTADMDDDGRGAPLPAHDNPTPNENAPRAPSRAERKTQPKQEADPAWEALNNRRLAIRKVYELWASDADKPDRIAMLKKASPEDKKREFRNWVRIVSQCETLDPGAPELWTAADDQAFDLCSVYFEQG
jgi:hypothetical protein